MLFVVLHGLPHEAQVPGTPWHSVDLCNRGTTAEEKVLQSFGVMKEHALFHLFKHITYESQLAQLFPSLFMFGDGIL